MDTVRENRQLREAAQQGRLVGAVESLDQCDLLVAVLPEIAALQGVEQPPRYHAEGDVYRHTLLVLRRAKPTPLQQWAALLHDTGKPATQEILDNHVRFHGHEAVSAEIAALVLLRLGLDELVPHVVNVVRNHMRPHRSHHWKVRTVRRFVRDLGDDLEAVLDLADADSAGSLAPDGQPAKSDTQELRRRIQRLEAPRDPAVTKSLPLSGHDVMRLLRLSPGPEVGAALTWLRGQPDSMTAEEAAEQLRRHFQ